MSILMHSLSSVKAQSKAVEKPRALILCSDGIQGDDQLLQAFLEVGFEAHKMWIEDAVGLNETELYERYQALGLPTGVQWSSGVSPGKLLALKIKHTLKWDLNTYASLGGVVIGIGNGFHSLISLGIFGRDLSITNNQYNRTLNQWVRVIPSPSDCIWLRGVGAMDLPIHHSKSKIIFHSSRKTETSVRLDRKEMICLKYENNWTGSEESIAGLCDTTGRIFGTMLNPELFIKWTSHPEWTLAPSRASSPGQGYQIFENAYQECLRGIQSRNSN